MKFLGITLSLFAAAFFFRSASAVELSIEGNAAGSDNTIQINSSQQTTVNQQNQMNVTNDVDANANTGGNSTDNGSVETGDASVFVKIKNFFNQNSADVDDCCPEGVTPTPPEAGQTPTPTVYDPGKPTPTPTPIESGQAQPPTTSSGGGGVGGGEILGLSAAAGEGTTEALFYTLGTLCLALAGAIWRAPKKLIA